MKKAAIIICAAVYAISIIIVTFLGYQAEIRNPPIYADEIVFAYDTPYQYVYNGAVIYTVTKAERVERSEEEKDLVEYKYNVKINEFEYLYEIMGGEMTLPCKPISYKVDSETGETKVPDNLNLSYNSGNEKIAEVDNEGKLVFKTYKDNGQLNLFVLTKDTSNLKIYFNIYWDVFSNN